MSTRTVAARRVRPPKWPEAEMLCVPWQDPDTGLTMVMIDQQLPQQPRQTVIVPLESIDSLCAGLRQCAAEVLRATSSIQVVTGRG